MDFINNLYFISLVLCVASCFGQLLHADVLTDFFIGNSRHKNGHITGQNVKTYNRNQNILPPVVNDYLDILLHKTHRGKVVDLQNSQQQTNVQSERRKIEKDRNGQHGGLRPLFLSKNVHGGRLKLFKKSQTTRAQPLDPKRDMQTPFREKIKATNLTRDEEILQTILKLRGINIDFQGKVKSFLATTTSRPHTQAPFIRLAKHNNLKSPFRQRSKQTSIYLPALRKVTSGKLSMTSKQTTPIGLPHPLSTMSSKFPSHTQSYLSTFTTTQRMPSSPTLEQPYTSYISTIRSKPQPQLTYTQTSSFPKPTQPATLELTSNPSTISMETKSLNISKLSTPITQLVEIIQPQTTLPITSTPLLFIQKRKLKEIYHQPRTMLPLSSKSQNSQKTLSPISSTASVTSSSVSVKGKEMSKQLTSIPPSTSKHFRDKTQTTVTLPTTFTPSTLSYTLRSFITKTTANTTNIHPNIKSVYQTIDHNVKSSKTTKKVLVAANANLFFEKLKGPNFLTDLNNGKDKTNKGNTVCAEECTVLQNVCKNGATCVKSCQGFTCHCAEGFTGYFCDKIVQTTIEPKL